jgi:isopentenyl-diphosphate Delta-isomerase
MDETLRRKQDHIDIVLRGGASHAREAGFDAIRFVHNALPEIDFAAIDTATVFLGHPLKIPYLASSMTGGPERAAGINRALAEAAQKLGFALGVGSQRVALGGSGDAGLGKDLRKFAPEVPIFANLGAVQLVTGMGPDDAKRAVDLIAANALILHLNPLQEAIQPEGDRNWRGVERAIAGLCRQLTVPIIVKEVGFGISAEIAVRLADCGVAAIDVAGAGGTSWAAVEGQRRPGTGHEALGEMFRDWGIPTAQALASVRAALPGLPLIASGGVRHGLDGAKAIRLGADLVGQAGPLLTAAVQGTDAVIAHVELWAKALKIAMFASGARNLGALREAALQE